MLRVLVLVFVVAAASAAAVAGPKHGQHSADIAPAAAASADGFLGLFTDDCPNGWSQFDMSKGRLLLAVNNSFQAGQALGLPLSDGEDRTHAHVLQGSIDFPVKNVAALRGLNTDGAKAGQQPSLGFENATSSEGSGYPFVQLTLCRYNANSRATPPALPAGGVAFWDPATVKEGCPSASLPLQQASGRLLALSSSPGWFASASPALEPGTDVLHQHDYTASISLNSMSFVGIDGCCDDDPTPDGPKTLNSVSHPVSTGLPHLAVLTCNVTQSSAVSVQAPDNFVFLTVAGQPCPAGWQPLNATLSGRFVVGTPQHGVPTKYFGAPAFPGLGTTWAPYHAHDFTLRIETEPAHVELASGCCAPGYGAAGTYIASGSTASTLPPNEMFPFFALQACQQA
jgi:hypothetical protein